MKLILWLVFILLFFPGFAQLQQKQLLYGNLGFSLGNFMGGSAGINNAVTNIYSLQLEYSGISRSSKSILPDYAGEFLLMALPVSIVGIFSVGKKRDSRAQYSCLSDKEQF